MLDSFKSLLDTHRNDCDQDTLKLMEGEARFFEKPFLRSLNHSVEQHKKWRAETVYERKLRVSNEMFDLFEGVVRYGPFKGLKLNRDNWWGSYDFGSMLLGIYELEILSYIASTKFKEFESFVDIGAADGYYAVGVLASGMFSNCVCYEAREEGRETIAINAINNGVRDNLEILGAAKVGFHTQLQALNLDKSLILVDVEGAEFDILCRDTLSQLQQATFVIEIHNWVDDFMEKYLNLMAIASEFFDISFLRYLPRDLTQFSELYDFTDDNRYLLCSESRPNMMRFMTLTPRTG